MIKNYIKAFNQTKNESKEAIILNKIMYIIIYIMFGIAIGMYIIYASHNS